jgi:hypothetical protein
MVNHRIFVVVHGSPDATASTIKILQFLAHCKPWFDEGNIRIDVQKVEGRLLANPRLVDSMARNGITILPALKTPNNVYLGVKSISDAYTRVVKSMQAQKAASPRRSKTLEAMTRRGEDALGGATEDDIYSRWAHNSINDDSNASEGGIGGEEDTQDMMSKFQEMTKKRAKSAQSRKPSQAAFLDKDNQIEDEKLIDRLIKTTVSGPVDEETLKRAYAGGEGSGDAAEDAACAAYWSNQAETNI